MHGREFTTHNESKRKRRLNRQSSETLTMTKKDPNGRCQSTDETNRTLSPQFLETLIDSIPCPVFYKNTHGVFLGCNAAFAEQVVGAPRVEIIGKTLEDLTQLIHPDTIASYLLKETELDLQHDRQIYEKPMRCADDHTRQYAIHSSTFLDADGRIAGMVGVMLDISSEKNTEAELIKYRNKLEELVSQRSAELITTNNRLSQEIEERRRAEAALKAGEERYRRVFENTGTATILVEQDMTISMVNATAEKLIGLPRKKIVGRMKTLEYVAPRDRDRIKLYHELRIQGDKKVPNHYEFQIVDSKERIRDVMASAQWIPDTRQIVISMVDITQNKQMQQERQRLAAVVEQSAEAVIVCDTHGNVEFVNKAFEDLTGYDRQECIGQDMDAPFLSDKDRKVFKQMTFMVSGEDNWSGRIENQRRDGQTYIADTRIFPIFNAKGKSVNLVCVKTDVTHEVQLEKQLQHSQKMEAIGTLAGGIAHDFNNILGGILGYTEISMRVAAGNEQLQRNFGRILDGCQRAKELVQNILTFSRKNEEETKPIEMRMILKEALKLLRASIPSTIEFQQRISPKSSIVSATATQIHQVIMNLCTNAAQAMQKNGGLLEVDLDSIELTAQECKDLPNTAPGAYVRLRVRDTGPGMDRDTLNRIFEPYFTTKKQTGGTGLGLSMVHGIVKTFGGTIRTTSRLGRGTTFDVYLPRIDDPAPSNVQTEPSPPKGNERILVVDDELFILEIMSDMLGALGYQVETVNGGERALQLFQQDPQCFDLVIADLTMPKMKGTKLAEKIKQINTDIPVILTTGQSYDADIENKEFNAFSAVLKKPIRYTELATTLRQVLDNAPGAQS